MMVVMILMIMVVLMMMISLDECKGEKSSLVSNLILTI